MITTKAPIAVLAASPAIIALRALVNRRASIDFGGKQTVDYGFSIKIRGHIDRASGRMEVTTVTSDPTKPDDPDIATLRYDMLCKATNGGGNSAS